MDGRDDEREERLHGGVRVRHEDVSARPEHGRRLEVLADPAGHEQVLVAVGIEQRGVVLVQAEPRAPSAKSAADGQRASSRTALHAELRTQARPLDEEAGRLGRSVEVDAVARDA